MTQKILLIDSYYGGSHQYWAQELQAHSSFEITIYSLKARHWKWRMHGGAITLFNQVENISQYDLILATDMVDLALFRALNKDHSHIPHCIYFHENQMAYPESNELRFHYLNYTSALVADKVFFNSKFNYDTFFSGARKMLKVFPDYRNKQTIEQILKKSKVLALGMNFSKLDLEKCTRRNNIPHLLWNHRWEFDKNPRPFFETLIQLKSEGHEFKLILLGKRSQKNHDQFQEELEVLRDNIVIDKEVEDYKEYLKWVWKADIIPVTSLHDFFGISIVEAIYCNTHPLLPNRLVYPDHIPDEYKSDYIYDDDNFKKKLEKLLYNWKASVSEGLISHISQFDWNKLIHQYDHSFKSLTKTLNEEKE